MKGKNCELLLEVKVICTFMKDNMSPVKILWLCSKLTLDAFFLIRTDRCLKKESLKKGKKKENDQHWPI